MGGWGGALGGGEGAARRWRGRRCCLGIIAVTAGATDVEAAVLGAAILVSFRPPRDYWVELAVQWAEFGSPMTDESVDERSKCAIENMEVENLIEKMAKGCIFPPISRI